MSGHKPSWLAGAARRIITPPPHVELAGLGYYLGRTGKRIANDLTATAFVASDGAASVAIVAMDLMWNDAAFTSQIRQQVAAATDIRPEGICVNFSHTHNAPTAGLILGAGTQNPEYLALAAHAAAEAIIEAWKKRKPARLATGRSQLSGMTFNRTREGGPVDTQVNVLRADTVDSAPIAILANFHSHCSAHMEIDLEAVGRDWPGEVVDQLEAQRPGTVALYLQGTCGDVNFRREYNGREKRFEPGRAVTQAVLQALGSTRAVETPGISAVLQKVTLPTRRWTREEIGQERDEGLYRLKTGDTTGWLDGVAKVCVNLPARLPLRYGGSVEKASAAVARFAVEWTDLILPDWEKRSERLETEIQTLRIGDVYFTASPCELFTTTGLEIRRQFATPDLFMLGFSNGSIGYLPDAYDVRQRSYAAIQSPKFTGQFPFTEQASESMANGLLSALERVRPA
jgi:hypothetical protein